ncbi:MAG: response regulator [Deltaproteobacteria bacterium]|nr:response regulator [Deltaproteobacteria bacterium]
MNPIEGGGAAPEGTDRWLAQVLHELGEVATDLDTLFPCTVQRVGELMGCGCELVTRDPDDPDLYRVVACWHADAEALALARAMSGSNPVRVGEGLRGRALQTRAPIRFTAEPAVFRAALAEAYREAFDRFPLRSLIAVPLVARGEVVGLVNLYRMGTGAPFTEADERFASDLASRIALVLANATLLDRVQRELAARRRAEAALQVYAELVEATQVGLIAVRLAPWQVLIANRPALRALGVATAADLGPGSFPPVVLAEARSARPETPAVVPGDLDLPGGVHAAYVVGLPGGAAGVALYDLAERRAHEEERLALTSRLLHTQKLESLGVLAGGIAHDFNNLLVGILGSASFALSTLPPHGQAAQIVTRIETAAGRASHLTRQLLAYSGKGRFVVQPIDLNRLVREMSELLHVSIAGRAVVRFKLQEPAPVVEADVAQIQQVVLNLITNASDAIVDGQGVITIATGTVDADRVYLDAFSVDRPLPEGRYARLVVSDTGVGMAKEVSARVFEPFFSTKGSGRGLGLSAVQGIVRSHGGALRIYSEAGKGTSMNVLLRACGDVRPVAPDRPVAVLPAGRRAVMVVDDDADIRELVRIVLSEAGYDVGEAADGVEAIAAFEREPTRWDAVLLDMTMPGLGGAETFAALRRLAPGVRVVLTSGYDEREATGRIIGMGLAGFLTKPWTVQQLLQAIAKVVAPT